jgi:hypothetical protein
MRYNLVCYVWTIQYALQNRKLDSNRRRNMSHPRCRLRDILMTQLDDTTETQFDSIAYDNFRNQLTYVHVSCDLGGR